MKRQRWLAPLMAVIILLTLWMGWQTWRGTPVRATQVKAAPLTQNVVAAGRVVTPSRAQVGVEITGTVEQRHVQEGDRVKQGDLLLTLRADELRARLAEAEAALENLQTSQRPQALATLAQAESELEQASREAQRRQDLVKSRSIATELYEKAAQAEVVARARAEQARLTAAALAPGGSEERIAQERLRAARAALDKTQVRAPFDGLVLSRQVEPGDQVQPGRVLLEIARTGDTEILVPVDERNLGILNLGQPARVIADAFPSQVIPASVSFIAPTIDPQRGTIDIKLALQERPALLREDMTVTATIITADLPTALLIANDALQQVHGDQATVLVVDQGQAREQSVKLGLRGLTHSQVLQGLQAGDAVITTPSVSAGQRVHITHVD